MFKSPIPSILKLLPKKILSSFWPEGPALAAVEAAVGVLHSETRPRAGLNVADKIRGDADTELLV